MEDGLKYGLIIGGIILLVSSQRSKKTPAPLTLIPVGPDVVTAPIIQPPPKTLPPPNIDGCIIPSEPGWKFELVDSSTCSWSKTYDGEMKPGDPYARFEGEYDPYSTGAAGYMGEERLYGIIGTTLTK